jgi:hypothetical protein
MDAPTPPQRVVVQIVAFECEGGSTSIIALCDDGRMYRNAHTGSNPCWIRIDTSTIEQAP